MKEATGEVSMTMVTIVAIAVIGSILAILWGPITNWIRGAFEMLVQILVHMVKHGVEQDVHKNKVGDKK